MNVGIGDSVVLRFGDSKIIKVLLTPREEVQKN